MKRTLRFILSGLVGLLVLTACSPAGKPAVPTVIYATSVPGPTQARSLPTPVPQGQVISYKDVRVSMSQAEITGAYLTEYGSSREPASGAKFLWIEVQFENVGSTEYTLPAPEHFSALYGDSEFKISYGHRQDHLDYTVLKPKLYPGQKAEAWLRFDIPGAAELKDLQFIFMPESFQLSFSSPSSGYAWADHPVYFWQCGP